MTKQRRISENMKRAVVRRLRKGATKTSISRELGISRPAIEIIARERAAEIESKDVFSWEFTDHQLREKCVEFISQLMAKGTWDQTKVAQLVKGFKVTRFEIATYAIEAAEKVSRGINPAMLSAVLEEQIHELRRLAYQTAKERPEVSVSARRAIGQIIVSLSKNNPDTAKATRQIIHLHQAPSQQHVSAKMGAEELIAKGWMPPLPLGLPAITDDEAALNNEFEERTDDSTKSSKS